MAQILLDNTKLMEYNADEEGGSRMKETKTRKCHACGQGIKVKMNNIEGVIYYKHNYYHKECFCKLAEERIKTSRGKSQEWENALNNIDELEQYTRELLGSRLAYRGTTDDLNNYLLSQYNVVDIPNRFWQVVADLSNGIYKSKRCNKVPTETLLETWKWGQQKLNEIDKYNKANCKGPVNDQQRIPYDLAIIVQKVPAFLTYKEKQKAAEAEREISRKENINIDYSRIKATTNSNDGLDDISDLLDELI